MRSAAWSVRFFFVPLLPEMNEQITDYEIMGGCFLMLATAFFTKFFMLRKKHELVVAISYTLIAIGWFTF